MLDLDPAERDRLHERARRVAANGFAAVVVVLSWQEELDGVPRIPESRDGVVYEFAPRPASSPIGADALRRSNLQLVAKRVADLHPCLLTTDGTMSAQAVAAAVGRAFALPVDFTDQLEIMDEVWSE